MKTQTLGLLVVAMLASGGGARAESRDEAALRATENRWSEAFVSGDAKTLDAILDPAYVSVSATGKPRGKAEIVALAQAYAAKTPGQHAQPMPPSSTIQVMGDAAIVRHRGPSDVSADVFYRRDGHWVAWYSQHTAAPA